MSDTHLDGITEDQVLASAPNFFRLDKSTVFAQRGLEIGHGWWSLVAKMGQEIEALLETSTELLSVDELRRATYCRQLKEKFGELRCYFTCPSAIQETLSAIIDKAVLESLSTCETCGQPGRMRTSESGYRFVSCDAHDRIALEDD